MRKAAATPVVDDAGPSKAWLDSYADAMTLLLAFFVLLYAFSLLDEKKFAEFRYGVEQAFSFASPAVPEGTGFLDEGLGINENAGQVAVVPSDIQNEIDEMLEEMAADNLITPNEVEQLKDAVESALAGAAIDVSDFNVDLDPRGVVITLNERLLFASGSALINREGEPALAAVSAVLGDLDNEVLVEGHTDSVPTTGTVWPTNWELSSARATAVLRSLSERYGINETRLSAVGHADTRPRGDNATADGRRQNRRTELVVLVDDTAATTSAIPFEAVDDPAGLQTGVALDPVDDVDIAGFPDPVFSGQ